MNKENKIEQKELVEDIQFMRSVIEKTCRKIEPGWPSLVTWGLIITVGFPVLYFLKIHQIDNWLWRIQWLMVVAGFCISAYFVFMAILQERKSGVISKLTKQIYLVFLILSVNGFIWTYLDLFRDNIGGFGFLWTAITGIELTMIGILYSKEWLYGGLAIFAGVIAARFTESYAYYILGIVSGFACIIPAIISRKNYHKQEKENAQA
jgi:hypothetical protein